MNKTIKKKNTYFENYDLYSDANPKDTIRVSYKNKEDLINTLKKLERLYKTGKRPHNRISQIANVLKQRIRVIKDNNPKIDKGRFKLISDYFDFLKKRTKIKDQKKRKELNFTF
jgi:hypothetical protein|tara:strand:- start:11 stop:352 length:342 start_codon:yes stop_codon:yes gene_type:complete